MPALKGCHTQAKSMPVLHKRLQEAIALCLEVEQSKHQPIPQDKFVAVQHIEVNLGTYERSTRSFRKKAPARIEFAIFTLNTQRLYTSLHDEE